MTHLKVIGPDNRACPCEVDGVLHVYEKVV